MKLTLLRNSIIVLGLSMFVFVSCQQTDVKKEAKDLRTELNTLQKELMANPQTLDAVKGDSMVLLYKKYAIKYPNDSMSVEYLFRAAEIQMGLNKNEECIKSLSYIQKTYPNSKVMPMLLQFKAFIYDDKFNDFDKARACMDELIENYPESELIPNAKAYRNMIGKNPEEIFGKMDSTATNAN